MQRWDRAIETAQHLEVLLSDREVSGDLLYKIGLVYYKAALSKEIYQQRKEMLQDVAQVFRLAQELGCEAALLEQVKVWVSLGQLDVAVELMMQLRQSGEMLSKEELAVQTVMTACNQGVLAVSEQAQLLDSCDGAAHIAPGEEDSCVKLLLAKAWAIVVFALKHPGEDPPEQVDISEMYLESLIANEKVAEPENSAFEGSDQRLSETEIKLRINENEDDRLGGMHRTPIDTILRKADLIPIGQQVQVLSEAVRMQIVMS